MRMVLVLLPSKVQRKPRRCRGCFVPFFRKKYRSQSATGGSFAAFWSAVNRGLRPRKVMYFLAAKSTKNSPADACAYFVPANVRNGRLFAGLQANRPRFLPLLAGTSFHGSGIGPESFAAKRGGEEAQQQDRKRSILPSPLKAVLNRRIIACSGTRTTDSPRARSGRLHSLVLAAPAQRGPEVVPAKATCGWFWYFCHQKYRESRDDVAGVLYLFSAKRYPKTPRQMPAPTSSRLTFETGAYSRVCKQTGPVSCHF